MVLSVAAARGSAPTSAAALSGSAATSGAIVGLGSSRGVGVSVGGYGGGLEGLLDEHVHVVDSSALPHLLSTTSASPAAATAPAPARFSSTPTSSSATLAAAATATSFLSSATFFSSPSSAAPALHRALLGYGHLWLGVQQVVRALLHEDTVVNSTLQRCS